jgi:hypothetical protein
MPDRFNAFCRLIPLKLSSLAAQTEGKPLMGQRMIGFGDVMKRKLVVCGLYIALSKATNGQVIF